MANIPNNILELLKAQETVKVLVTSNKDGKPHAIVAGSIAAQTADTMIVGEILMKRSSKNLKENSKAAFLIASGTKAYEIECVAKARLESGPELDAMNKALEAIGMQAAAVWIFSVNAVYDQGASPNAGTKLA